ncbi:aminoglycoside phosphotransferase/kinase family protein [Flindersiella endophytica]
MTGNYSETSPTRWPAPTACNLSQLTVQIVHGDLASPNVLLRDDKVAAIIDFWPPMQRYVSWEIVRIGCDPGTVLAGDQWVTGLPDLLAAYREEHPAARPVDLISSVAVGCAWTLASTYTLVEPLERPNVVDASLLAYGRARHEAALAVLDRLDEVQEMLHDHFR